jgi:hypothetical protein
VRVTSAAPNPKVYASAHYNADVGKVLRATAWIVEPDGKKTKVYGQSDFTDVTAEYGAYFWNSSRVIFIGRSRELKLGSVLAWEIALETKSGVFDSGFSFLNPSEPVMLGVFEVQPMEGGTLAWHCASPAVGAPVAAGRGLKWEVRGVAPLPHDQPPGFYPDTLSVSVRCETGGADSKAPNTWKQLALLTHEIVGPKIQITPELKAKAEALTAGRSTRWERVRALTEFVQKEVTYLSVTQDRDTLAGYRPHSAPEVLKNRFGDCKDKATFLAALLRAIGDEGHVVLVFSGDPGAIRADWPAAAFNHAISAIPADDSVPEWWPTVDAGSLGRLVLFDPTHPQMPLGTLPVSDQGGHGLICHAEGQLIAIPGEDPKHCGVKRKIRAALDERGTITVDVEEDYLGTEGAELHAARETQRREKFSEILLRRIQQSVPLAREITWSDAWSPVEARYRLSFTYRADRQLRALGRGRFVLNPEMIAETLRMPAWKIGLAGVTWRTARMLEDETRVTLPQSISAIDLPAPWRSEDTGLSATVVYRAEAGELVLMRTFASAAGFSDRTAYEAARKKIDAFQTASRRPLILQQSEKL